MLFQTSDRVDLPPVFLVASKKASNPDEAWRRLIQAFDTIRGLMEYGLGFGRMQISFGKPRPRSRVPHPDWVLIKNTAQPLQGWRFVTEVRDDGPFTSPLRADTLTSSADWRRNFEGLRMRAQLLLSLPTRFACMHKLWRPVISPIHSSVYGSLRSGSPFPKLLREEP